MGWFKRGLNFNKKVFGGGYIRDALNPGGGGASGQGAALAALNNAKEATRIGTLQQQATQRSALPIVAKAFDSTRANLAQSAERSKRRLDPAQNPLLAQQPLNAVGMGASSLAPLAQQQQRRETARAYSEIDNLLAQQLNPLATQQAVATSGILGQNAGLGMHGLAMQNDLQSQLAQAYMRPKRRKKSLFDLVGAVAPIIGAVAGGPAGAAGASGLAGVFQQQGQDDYTQQGLGYAGSLAGYI